MSQSRNPKLAYTVNEAAEMLSLSRAHVYRLLDVQELKSVTIGRSRRITAGQLGEYVKELESRSGRNFDEFGRS